MASTDSAAAANNMMQQQPVTFVTRLSPNDVLVGRGAPSNSNPGNKRFRDLVQSRKREYMSTGKRQIKDRIAREIVETITGIRRGRFVRKIESLVEAEQMGVPEGMTAWTVVAEETAIQKTKQALRDRDVVDAARSESPTSSLDRSNQSMGGLFPPPPQQPANVGDYLRSLRGGSSLDAAAAQIRALDASHLLGLGGSGGFAFPSPSSLLQSSLTRPQTLPPDLQALLLGRSALMAGLPQRAGGDPFAHRPDQMFNIAAPSLPEGRLSHRTPQLPRSPGAAALRPVRNVKQKVSDEDETAGERAIREALERASDEGLKSGNHLELSLVEIHLLSALCSHGLPVWTSSSGDYWQQRSPRLDWAGLSSVVEKVAKDFDRLPTKNTDVARISRSSVVEASIFDAHPKELAKKAVTLLECVRSFAGKDGDMKKANYTLWLEEELFLWASSLNVAAGEGSRAVAYNSQTFLRADEGEGLASNDLLRPMGYFDKAGCQDVFSQIAAVTRLRSVAERCTSFELRPKVLKASQDCQAAGRDWSQRPSWWGADSDPIGYDLLLLDRLVRDGYLGVVDGPTKPEDVSLQRLGLTKSGVQERVEQLVESLHEQQVAEDRLAVMLERKKRFLSELGQQSLLLSLGAGGSMDPRKRQRTDSR